MCKIISGKEADYENYFFKRVKNYKCMLWWGCSLHSLLLSTGKIPTCLQIFITLVVRI